MKTNPRVTKKDHNNIKGALRRAFARSELRNKVLQASVVKHSDPERPRVKTWCRCAICGLPDAKSYCVVDHIDPFVPIGENFADMNLHVARDRMWCEEQNLQTVCRPCHLRKSSYEAKLRKEAKK